MNNQRHCSKCGQLVDPNVRFCGACGQPSQQASPQQPPPPQQPYPQQPQQPQHYAQPYPQQPQQPQHYAQPYPQQPQHYALPHATQPQATEPARKRRGALLALLIVGAAGAVGAIAYVAATSAGKSADSTDSTDSTDSADSTDSTPPDPTADLEIAPPPPMPAHERSVDDVTVGGTKALTSVIDELAIAARPLRDAPAFARSAYETAAASDRYVLSSTIVSIEAPERPGGDSYLGGRVSISLPLAPEQRERATRTNVGAVYLSVKGPEYVPGHLDPSGHRVLIQTGHLSEWVPAVETKKGEIARIIKEEALAQVNAQKEVLIDKAIEATEEYLKQFDSLDGGTKKTILLAVLKQREDLGKMFSASGGADVQKFNESLNIVIGKAIVDNVGESQLAGVLKTVTDSADVIGEVSEAAGHAAGGDYWKAIEILGKAYSKRTTIYQVVDKTVKVLRFAEGVWKEHEWESAYRAYTEGAPRTYLGIHKEVSAGHWAEIEHSYGGIVDFVIRNHNRPDGGQLSREEASALAKKMFDERRAREQAAAKESARLNKMLAWLVKREESLLMTRLAERARTLDKDGRMDKPATVRRFFQLMQNVQTELARLGLPCCGGDDLPLDAQDLVYAYVDGGPAAFHKAVAKIRSRVARKLNLGKTAPVDAGAPDSARVCAECDKLETCCVRVTDRQSSTICYEALRMLRERCSQPPPMPTQMNLSCQQMHKAWLEAGQCQ